jgi:DNA polymerase (family X)
MVSLYRLGNDEIASQLEEASELLSATGADVWRVRALRAAADTVRAHGEPIIDLLEREHTEGLTELPDIGPRIAAGIAEMAHRGRWSLLDRLRGDVDPVRLISTLPGIGPTLAARVHEDLGIETLEALELAAHDGRLARVPGFGPRRSHAVRELLAARLGRSTRQRARSARGPELVEVPPVELLLRLDARYRDLAAHEQLPKIAPRRFNPSHDRWLPILHAQERGWHFTVMFSNTALAHRLGRTGDWVVLYFEKDGREGQCTVVTEHRGPRAGQRVVRGREREQGGGAPAKAASEAAPARPPARALAGDRR